MSVKKYSSFKALCSRKREERPVEVVGVRKTRLFILTRSGKANPT